MCYLVHYFDRNADIQSGVQHSIHDWYACYNTGDFPRDGLLWPKVRIQLNLEPLRSSYTVYDKRHFGRCYEYKN